MADIVLTKAQRTKIDKAVKSLNDVRAELQRDNPDKDISWYLEDCSNLNLMEDESHDSDGCANQHSVIQHFHLDNASGGGW